MINNEQDYFRRKEELDNKYANPFESTDMIYKRYMGKYSKEYLAMQLIECEREISRHIYEKNKLENSVEKLKIYINGCKGLKLSDYELTNYC
jgi:hypothetical protein